MYTTGMTRGILILLGLALVALGSLGAWQWQEHKDLIDPAWFGGTPFESWSNQLLDVGEVLTPEPLKGPINQPGGQLTTAGTLAATNRHRAIYDLAPLRTNAALDSAAQKKVDDMFMKQYFAHEAPDGTGPADLVTAVNYQYIRVGENLALGNFASDGALVQAWMDSPGHRENILHKGFSEIGLAVGEENFEGTRVWLAVQTFAAPLASCPRVDPALKKEFDQQKVNLDQLSQYLKSEQDKLELEESDINRLAQDMQDTADAGHQKIQAGNEHIEQGNKVYQETRDRSQAQPDWDRGAQLQADGQSLVEQAQQKQIDYETRAKDYDTRRAAFNTEVQTQRHHNEIITDLVSRLNQQIRAFNDCIK